MAGTTDLSGMGISAGIQQAMSTSNAITDEGLGIAFSGINNQIQAKQNQVLTNQQLAANEQLSAYNYQQQLQLWQETNYPAQVNEMQQAGLNPALLYGGRGGGATATTGSPSGGIGMGIAPGTTPAQTAQLALQAQATQADVQLKQAQAANIQAKTPQEGALMNTQIASLTQGINNSQAQQALTEMQTTTWTKTQ